MTWFLLLLSSSATLVSRLVALVSLADPALIDEETPEGLGFPISAALGEGKPACRNSMRRLKVGAFVA